MKRAALAAGAALALVGCGDGEAPSPKREFVSDVQACQQRLRRIYGALLEARVEQGELPGSGPELLGRLITDGVIEDTPETRWMLTCPGVGVPKSDAPPDPTGGLTDEETAYAVRDLEAFPLPTFPGPGTHVIAACEEPTNHAEVTNLLYADGSVVTVPNAERTQGTIAEDLAKLR